MTAIGWIQIILYCAIIAALTRPLGWYMTRVFNGERTLLSPVLRPVEAGIYWIGGVDERREQHWMTYTIAMLLFHVGGVLIIYGVMRLQAVLPFNPAGQSAVAEDLSFTTALSLITNASWQNYGGESTISYLVQMVGLTHQNFLSAATGIALAVALIRGFSRSSMRTIGNFWVDVTRCTLYVLLPICMVYTLFLVWQGMPQTLGAYVEATTLEGARQTIAVGPVASQVAIKMLGTNGGGFFNANAAHPFENPTALSNFVQMISIFALGAALTNVFGRMVGNQRQGWAILAVMGVLFLSGVAVTYWAEANGTSTLATLGLSGGNMEGKEVRFGIVASSLFAVSTTAASCGLTGNTFFYNLTLASSMFVGRFFMIVPAMALAGSLAAKKSIPPSAGTLPTTGGLFVGLVVGVILIIGGLTFFPALALGPIVEHLAMSANTLF